MGNSLKRGYKAISLRDLRASKSLGHHHTPANCQDEKPKTFMRIEEEDQLDEILDAIEQALKKFQHGTDQRAPAQYLGTLCSGFNDAASMMNTLSQNCESLNSQVCGG
jgi:cell division septum initiation protein DivIVA